MINLPELAKPTSSMESLQPIKFGSTQSYLWKPGYHIYQSGDITKFFSCTRTHRIRRILEEIIKHTQSHLWKDWTILRFNHYQPNQLRPEDILTKPQHPEEIIGDQQEFCKFIPCTGQHRIMRILINTNLPYLELLAFKLQQLFYLEFMHDIITIQAIQKIPRNISYPLRPSRFKKNQVFHLDPKIPQKAPTASFRFFSLFLICFLSYIFRTLEPLYLSII